MSDEMNDLIAEARECAPSDDAIELTMMVQRLADDLEAATRQPSENDREATEAEIDKAARVLHMAKCCSLNGDSPHDFPEASEVFAAGVVLNAVPLAAVPDAAPEDDREALRKEFEFRIRTAIAHGCAIGYRELSAQDREEWVRGQVDRAVGSRTAVPGATTEQAFKKAEAFDKAVALSERRQTLLEEAKAERDAALAAIERVRELHQAREDGWCSACAETNDQTGEFQDFPCPTIRALRAALDGAPEPEWEWAVQVAGLNSSEPMYFEFPDPLAAERFIKNGALWYTPRPNGDPKALVRRRKAGPWLPVEGEKP